MARKQWRPLIASELCDHTGEGFYHAGRRSFYDAVADAFVARRCRFCWSLLADPEPRCDVILAGRRGTRGRRCLAPGRFDGRCRVHRLESMSRTPESGPAVTGVSAGWPAAGHGLGGEPIQPHRED